MDRLIASSETAFDLFRRYCTPSWRTGLAVFDSLGDDDNDGGSSSDDSGGGSAVGGLRAGELIELYGESNAGKTEMLLNLVVSTVLPEAAGGRSRPALYFDHDCRLDLRRLRQLLQHRLHRCLRAGARSKMVERQLRVPPAPHYPRC